MTTHARNEVLKNKVHSRQQRFHENYQFAESIEDYTSM